MGWKITVVGIVMLVGGLLVTGYLYFHNQDYNHFRDIVENAVKDATGRTCVLGGGIEFAFSPGPTLVATDIALANASWGSQPDMVKIQRLRVQLRLWPLVFGELVLGNLDLAGVEVLLETNRAGQGNWTVAPRDRGTKRFWAIRHVEIGAIHIGNLDLTFRDDKTGWRTQFNSVDLDALHSSSSDKLTFQLKGEQNGEPVALSGEIDSVGKLIAGDPFRVAWSGRLANGKIEGDGRMEKLIPLEIAALEFRASGTNLKQLGDGINIGIIETSAFEITGNLKGPQEALRLEKVEGTLRRGDVKLTVNGSADNLNAWNGMDLQVGLSGKDLEQLGQFLGQTLPKTDSFRLEGRLKGSADALGLTDAKLIAKKGALAIDLVGGVANLATREGIDIQLRVAGNDLGELGPLLGKELPKTGPFNVEGRLTGSKKTLVLSDARGSISQGGLKLDLKGKIGDLLKLADLDLKAKGSGQDLTQLGLLLGKKLPTTGPFTVEGRLTGAKKALMLSDAQGSIGRGGLALDLTGKVGDLLKLADLDLRAKGAGKDLTELGSLLGKKLPATGPFTMEGRLTGSHKVLALSDVRGSIGRGGLTLDLTGKVGDLLKLADIDLRAKGTGNDLAELGSLFGNKLPATGPISVNGQLRGSGKSLRLSDARVSVSLGGARLVCAGDVGDLRTLDDLRIEVETSGEELSEIGPLLGMELPKLGAFAVRGFLTGSPRAFALDNLKGVIGRSDFEGAMKVALRQRPKISLTLRSGLFDVTPLIPGKGGESSKDRTDSGKDRWLEKPLAFDFLDTVDADVTVNARRVSLALAWFELGQLALTLEAGELKIDKLNATYHGARFTGGGYVKSGPPTRIAVQFLVQDYNLGAFLTETQVTDQVTGHIDIGLNVSSQGDSARVLLAKLNGEVGAVMGHGHIDSDYLDWLAVGLTRKILTLWGNPGGAEDLDCGVVEFDIKRGLATSKAFVFDTGAAIITGEGTINLGTGALNFRITPTPKQLALFTLASTVRVSGTVENPKVRPDVTALATKGITATLGVLALGPFGLLAPFVSLGAHDKHPCDFQHISLPQ